MNKSLYGKPFNQLTPSEHKRLAHDITTRRTKIILIPWFFTIALPWIVTVVSAGALSAYMVAAVLHEYNFGG